MIASDHRRDWRTIDERPLLDLAVLAGSSGDELLATTPSGELLCYKGVGRAPSPVVGAPPLAYIDWAGSTKPVGSSAGGDIFTSTTGDDWQQVGAAVGEVTALDAGPGAWHLATEGGVSLDRRRQELDATRGDRVSSRQTGTPGDRVAAERRHG